MEIMGKKYNLSLGPAPIKNRLSGVEYEGRVFFICTIGNTHHLAKVYIRYTPKDNVVFDFDVMDSFLKDFDGKVIILEQAADEIYSFVNDSINPEKLLVEISYVEKEGLPRKVIMGTKD